MIRENVSSNLDVLEFCHLRYPWIPGMDQVRPKFEILAKKYDFMDSLFLEWFSLKDFLLYEIFGIEYSLFQGKKLVLETETRIIEKSPVLKESMFPYNVQGYHYVLWFPGKEPKSEEIVQENLENLIPLNVQFVWYLNPKPSVDCFFHVQVFTDSKFM